MADWGPFSVKGLACAVTGAAKGIGLGIARRLAEGGAKVLLADHDHDGVHKEARELEAGAPGRIAWMAVDVAGEGAGIGLVERCVREFGRLDLLVNNAGIFPMESALKMSPEFWDRVQGINLRGAVFICQAAGRQFQKQGGGGSIVNIASIDSVHPSMPGLAAYDASKGGLLSFTKSFALEMAPLQVRVNAIEPGGIATPGASKPLEGSGMSPAQMKEFSDNFIRTKVPLARMGVPDDIAKAVVFLASDASSYITGAALLVDGGTLLT